MTRFSVRCFIVVFVALIGFSTVALAGSGPLAASLEMDATWLSGSEDVLVHFSLTNTTAGPLHILSWQTPFAGIEEDLFEVSRNGQLLPYLGPHYKRPAPTAEDYILLAPGETRTATVELSSAYDMAVTGEYTIRYRLETYDLVQNLAFRGRPLAAEVSSNRLLLWIEGREAPTAGTQAEIAFIDSLAEKALTPTFTGRCSNTQQSQLIEALGWAETISGGAYTYLNTTPVANRPSSQRYGTWFGTYDSGRWSTVEGNFSAIHSAFATQAITLDCKCKQNYYAYVYPTQPYKIYLCKVFWTAPMTGTDSKAGTLVHEMSHFNVVAGTDDVTYGQTSCKNLAISNPNQAIQNADSHEYFAENTPALP